MKYTKINVGDFWSFLALMSMTSVAHSCDLWSTLLFFTKDIPTSFQMSIPILAKMPKLASFKCFFISLGNIEAHP